MAKKKISSESGKEIRFRSKSVKPFYKKWWFWTLLIVVLLVILVGNYILQSDTKIRNESYKPEREMDVTETEEKASALKEPVEEVREESYTYEDFKGTYVLFEGAPYNSPISGMSDLIVLTEDSYQTFNRWDYDMTSPILSKNIKDDILTINLDSAENEIWGRHSESGTEEFKLDYQNDRKILYSTKSDNSYYSLSSEDLQSEYKQLEIDYARIIMTILGQPSLDLWAVWKNELGTPIINVSYHAAGDSTEVSEEVTYPEKVTQLSLIDAEMVTRTITYSTQGDGYIKVYPIPLPYNQDDQSAEENIRIAKQAINDTYTIYVEPFEPYDVADFIGHVEFDYR